MTRPMKSRLEGGVTLGEQVRAGRDAKRMTLRQLARALKVSAPFLSDVEHDRRNLSPDLMKRAAKVLDLDPVLLEAAQGYTRELADWVRRDPRPIAMLRESRRTGQPLRIGGENCPCRNCRSDSEYERMLMDVPMDAPTRHKP